MRTVRGIALALAIMVSGCATALSPLPSRTDLIRTQLLDPDGKMLIVAHRACWREAPENSLEAIAACTEMGVHLTEIDIRQTADGELVVFHDKTVERTTNGSGRVSDLNLADLKSLGLREGRGGPGAPITDSVIPTLREVLKAARGEILLCLDVKDPVHDAVLKLIEDMDLIDETVMLWLAAPDDPELSAAAFNGRMMVKPSVYFGDERNDEEVLGDYLAIAPVALTLNWKNTERFDWASSKTMLAGTRVWATTLRPADDRPEVWSHLAENGVTIIQTDRPRAAMMWLSQVDWFIQP